MENVILWGAGAQAKVARPILESQAYRIIGLFDNDPGCTSPFADLSIVGGLNAFVRWQETAERCAFLVTIAGERRGRDRLCISRDLENRGFKPAPAVHSRAWIANSAKIGKGCQMMALSGVGESATIGDFCIINTNATVDHDCRLGNGIHIMPGATVAGEVDIGDCATVGCNATILPRIKIGANAVVAAGAVVTRSVPDGFTVVGNPARIN